MATASASYRTRQPALTLEVRCEQNEPILSLTPGQVARTLTELCALGFLEAFKDEHNITRYRPVQRAA